ncbi:reverse transcriptase domain-containing protein [Tanacetum coccineum]
MIVPLGIKTLKGTFFSKKSVGSASPTYAAVVENISHTNDGTTLVGPNHTDGIHTTETEDIIGSVESNADFILPLDAIDKVKSKFKNSLVGFVKVMKNDDGIFRFKFAYSTGMEQVLDRAPWLIRNTSLILNKWTPSLPLKKDVVTKVPIWVKLHKVPLVTYSEDGLSLIATQIGKPLMLYAYTSSMCGDAWGCINFSHALDEVSSGSNLEKKVTMAVPNEDETSYTGEVISVEYEWQPPMCANCKIFGHSSDRCPKIVRDPVSTDTNSDEFTEVKRKKHKGKKADMQPRSRQIEGIRLNMPKPNFYWQKTKNIRRRSDMDLMTERSAINKINGPSTSNFFDALYTIDVEDECGTSSSKDNQVEEHEPGLNDHVESDDEVDEFIFPEGDKFGNKFDIRLKGRVRK